MNYLHTGVAQWAGNRLDTVGVAAQAQLGEEDAVEEIGDGHRSDLEREITQLPEDVSESTKSRLDTRFFNDCIVGALQ